MKACNLLFKIAAIVLAIGAAVCVIIANLEKISNFLLSARSTIAARRDACCFCDCDDAEEYEDWDF